MNAELHPAFMWNCPECDRENFCRAVIKDMDPELGKKFNEKFATSFKHVRLQTSKHPDYVKCDSCGGNFKAERA